MKSPEHFQSLTPTPEQGDVLESQIQSIKQEGKTLIKEIQDIIQEGEANTNPEERANLKQQAEAKIRELTKLKRKLGILKGEIEESSFTPEAYLTSLHPFMLETYKDKWSYNEKQLETVEQVISNPDNIHIDEEIPFKEMVDINKDSTRLETNKSKAGELYLTSEQIDFETAKPFIPEIPEDIKKQGVSGVMKYIHETYKDTHILPDLKYYQYLAQLADQYKTESDPIKKETLLKQIPEQFKDGNYYYFPGSALVDGSGGWMSPCLRWGGDEFHRDARRVERSWVSAKRVVLLER